MQALPYDCLMTFTNVPLHLLWILTIRETGSFNSHYCLERKLVFIGWKLLNMLFFLNLKDLGFLVVVCFLSLHFQCLDKVTFWPEQYTKGSKRSWVESRTDIGWLTPCMVSGWLCVHICIPFCHRIQFLIVRRGVVRSGWQVFLFSYLVERPSHLCSVACVTSSLPERRAVVFCADMPCCDKVIVSWGL